MTDTLFARAWRDMPDGVELDPHTQTTIDDLRLACLLTLDLCDEGQDAAEGIDPRPIRRWLRKYGWPSATK